MTEHHHRAAASVNAGRQLGDPLLPGTRQAGDGRLDATAATSEGERVEDHHLHPALGERAGQRSEVAGQTESREDDDPPGDVDPARWGEPQGPDRSGRELVPAHALDDDGLRLTCSHQPTPFRRSPFHRALGADWIR